jgi:hypothetical protein
MYVWMERSSYHLLFLFYGGVVSKYLTRLTSKGGGKKKKESKKIFCSDGERIRRWE